MGIHRADAPNMPTGKGARATRRERQSQAGAVEATPHALWGAISDKAGSQKCLGYHFIRAKYIFLQHSTRLGAQQLPWGRPPATIFPAPHPLNIVIVVQARGKTSSLHKICNGVRRRAAPAPPAPAEGRHHFAPFQRPIMAGSASPDAQISGDEARAYWSDVPATVDGMLGGYGTISRIDLRGSHVFVARLRRSAPGLLERGADCGAGIGRVTAGLLSHVCATVDVVEPIARFAAQAEALPADQLGPGRIGTVFVAGLEDWAPPADAPYDLIWHQWCLGQLNNAHLARHLRRCAGALRPGGWIVAKENIASFEDTFDDTDSSVTRTDPSYRAVFADAGLKVVASELQHGFPKSLGLYPVRFYALQPAG